ncbi:MAG: hypothetical protein LBT27_08755 [Prevotellaceae bacterium]|jgi:hypothetical protein|nr:hypothetical protein [Prevotellaceae bacterium]
MVLVWARKGYIPVLFFIVLMIVGTSISKGEHFDYVIVSNCFLTGIFCWYFGKKWNHKLKKKILIDEETGKKYVLTNYHTLFWIQVQYWGIIFPIFGIIILVQKSIIAAIISFLILAIVIFMQKSKNGSVKITDTNKKTIVVENEIKESEEEKQERLKEKEDPNRFMPQ